MALDSLPDWMVDLETEDLNFIRNFVLVSGSLKEMAHQYSVSYPTVRLRLDRLIQKIRATETEQQEPYVQLIKKLAIDDRMDVETAKLLITEYRKQQKQD
ncbi:MAG: DUF2089 family protein [Clostridia bacterium]|nr:DUF2089 family protein [Clostridia bacterium]